MNHTTPRALRPAMLLAATLTLAACGVTSRSPDTARKLKQAPDFALKDTSNQTVTLADATQGGYAVLVFYRGHW